MAYGVKSQGFSYFLLLFYSQALGMDAFLVGLAIFITFMVDAVSDPIVGWLSDNTNTRWGRRHPYMYASALPIAIAFWFLWNPPDGVTGNDLFPYLLILSILVRTLITLYEIPTTALAAEFTTDYHQRTSLFSYRNFFGYVGGIVIGAIALFWLLNKNEISDSGYTDVEGFGRYGLVAALMIFVSIMVGALGTHRTIPYLQPRQISPQGFSFTRLFREVFETLSHKSFGALFAANLFAYTAAGVAASLTYYIYGYFWGFSADQASLITVSLILSSFCAMLLAPVVSRWLGKKRAAITVGLMGFTLAPLPVILRLIGWMPENGSPILYPLILAIATVDYVMIIMVAILMSSMVADLVEDSQLRTGRRSEGLFFAGITFTRKAVEGGGIFMSAMILSLIDFPKTAAPEDVPAEAIFRLGAFYAPTIYGLWMLMLFSLSFYRIDQKRHEDNVRKLDEMADTGTDRISD